MQIRTSFRVGALVASALSVSLAGCAQGESGDTSAVGSDPPTTDAADSYGEPHEGQYHLGPVDFAETQWHNACAPAGGYRSELRLSTGLGGEYLAGVSNDFMDQGAVCDSCVLIETDAGRSIVARVVTYGVANAPGDLDVSPSVYEALDQGEYPRSMRWSLGRCPDAGPLAYEFQTEANPWWTSLWVRSPRVPLRSVEVRSANHPQFTVLRRGADGTLNDDSGFGEGEFTLRLVGVDGQVITDTFSGFAAGELIVSAQQFD